MLKDDLAEAIAPAPAAVAECRAPEASLARTVLNALDAAGVRWCLLRGSRAGADPIDDVDLLVAPQDRARAMSVMRSNGLVHLRSFGRGTHTFWLGLDEATTSWVEFDLVTELAYGRHLELPTDAARHCLARRQRRSGTWFLAPDDEFWALLLHVVLDKNTLDNRHLRRLERLRHEASLDSPLAQAIPGGLAAALLEYARAGDWSMALELGDALRSAWWSTQALAAARRSITSVVLRSLERPLQAWQRRGISVALLGPDGAGKSTLADRIASACYFPVRRVYLGLWPSQEAGHGLLRQAIRVIVRPITVVRRYAASLRHRALGRMVVFDRYVYDALLPPSGRCRRLKRAYFLMLSRLCPAPNLVLLLDAPGHVLHARSNEYDPAHLEVERVHYRRLSARIPRAQQLDANRPADDVLRDAIGLIWQCYVEREHR